MKFAASFRNLSLGLATASFLMAGAAFAQSTPMVGVNVRLDHTLNTKNAVPGQMIAAKLDSSIKTIDGFDLAKGTELMGKVDRVQASQNGGPATLSLIFNSAQTKNGKQIPVKVTLLGAYPSGQQQDATYGTESMGPAPRHVNPQEQIDQEAGLLSHVSMHSAVKSNDSATFRKNDGDIKLTAGTYFQVGIAPAMQNRLSAGA